MPAFLQSPPRQNPAQPPTTVSGSVDHSTFTLSTADYHLTTRPSAMFYRPLVLLSCLSLIASTSAHIIQPAHLAIRQNEPEASPSIDPDTGAEASPSPEAEASVSPSPDSAASAETPEQSTDVGPAVSSQDILAGAGTGGQVPVACFSCEDVYSDVV